MKWSTYNELITNHDDEKIVHFFNYFRNKLLTLDKKLEVYIRNNIDNPIKIQKIHPELYKSLLTEKFILPDEFDETAECINEIERRFNSDEFLRMTINPTLDCNLRCWYCYENHIKDSVMSNEVINNIGALLEKKVASKTLNRVQLSFFGGEPLLQYNKVIKPLASLCRDICMKHEKELTFHFTTNGVCLTPKVVKELKALSSQISVQVAFDGGKDFHDKVKCFPSGSGSYDIVKRQLYNAIQNGIRTTIRCNYTLDNLDSFCLLIDDFKEYWEYHNVRFSFHKVWQEAETPELHLKIGELKNKISKINIQSNIQALFGYSISPCYADFDNNYVINYNGDVYKCTARDFKSESRIGYLSSRGDIILNDNANLLREQKLTNECKECRLLPICIICFQQRRESLDGKCPIVAARENATENIKKYYHDVLNLQN